MSSTDDEDRRQRDAVETASRRRKMFERSGEVSSADPLVGFLYLLTRDHVTPGTVEEIMKQVFQAPESTYSNGWLAKYAMDVADRIRNPE